MDPATAHDADAERALLAAIIRGDSGTFFAVRELSGPADFYDPGNRAVFVAMDRLVQDGRPLDLALIADVLRETGQDGHVGGPGGLADRLVVFLGDHLPEPWRAAEYALIVRRHAERRRACKELDDARKAMETTTADEALAPVLRFAADLGDTSAQVKRVHVADAAEQALGAYQEPDAAYLTTGYPHLDAAIRGLQPGELVVIGGRPFTGKTRFLANLLPRMAATNPDCPVLLETMEEDARAIGETVFMSSLGVSGDRIRAADPDELSRLRGVARSGLSAVPFYIERRHKVTTDGATGIIRQARRVLGARVVAFDNLQLMEDKDARRHGNRVQEIAALTRALKVAASETGVVVIAVSHLNRAVEGRDDKRPMLSDLRDSGSIEQDADLVAFLYSEDYQKNRGPGAPGPSVWPVEVIVRKRRNGRPATVPFLFYAEDCSFRASATAGDRSCQRKGVDSWP